MASLIIRDIPPELHRRLKAQAKKARRSMGKEALHLIEQVMAGGSVSVPGGFVLKELPVPYKGRFPLTDKLINKWKREGLE